MASDLMLLHGSDADISAFNALRAKLPATARLNHVVRPDWVARAKSEGITWQLNREIECFVRRAKSPVMCTNAVLGAVAERAGGLRLDRPMMRRAAEAHVPLLLACASEGEAAACLGLLEESMTEVENYQQILPIVLERFLPLYASGDRAGFAAAVAAAVLEVLDARPEIHGVVLAHVAMAPVEHHLAGTHLKVFSAPEQALREALVGASPLYA